MIRKIIHIDTDACTGCGLCAEACHEGAIQMIDGKAVLTREDYCDGLGDCLPACPAGAISFVEPPTITPLYRRPKRPWNTPAPETATVPVPRLPPVPYPAAPPRTRPDRKTFQAACPSGRSRSNLRPSTPPISPMPTC